LVDHVRGRPGWEEIKPEDGLVVVIGGGYERPKRDKLP